MSQSDSDDGGESTAVPPGDAVARIEARAEQVREEQVQQALSELEGELSPRERAEIERLADRLTEQLLGPPREALREAARRDDVDAARVALDLFGS